MARISTIGKHANVITVGDSKAFDYQDLSSAWSAITDSSSTNPYVIRFFGQHDVDAPVVLSGKTDITIVGEPGSYLRKPNATGSGGGTLVIGTSSDTTERIGITGMHIINELAGGSATGEAPEGALYIGPESTWDTDLNWNDISVWGNRIEGVHDALQIFGQMAPVDSGPARPGKLTVWSNSIISCHDAYTVKGDIQLESSANNIYVRSSGVSPYLTNVEDWKHTGIHYNFNRAATTPDGHRGDHQWCQHVGENIYVVGDGNTGESKNGQDRTCGVLFYQNGSGYRASFHGCKIQVIYDADYEPASRPYGGVVIDGDTDVDDGLLRFTNCDLTVRQINSGASAPSSVSGFRMTGTAPAAKYLEVFNTSIRVDNVKAGTNYSLQTEDATATLRHGGIISQQATDATGGGTITAVAALT